MQEKKKELTVKCPTCRVEAPWQGNAFRPFCSERCKLIDLGNWADGTYNVESVEPPDFSDEGQDNSNSMG
jgi:uncharacterized protein